MSHGDYNNAQTALERRYDLKTVYGVNSLLRDIHKLREARFSGTDTTTISNILVDFELTIKRAGLTEKQEEALFLLFENDFTQAEVSKVLGISQQAVSKHIDNAIKKIVVKAKEEENVGRKAIRGTLSKRD